MKISVIGAGSTYTPELVAGFLDRHKSIGVGEICLMDIDPQRLEIVGGFAQRILQAEDSPFLLELTTDVEQAISGASYVITQLRVGMNAARREDEYLGRKHGLVGQETTGVGGMAKALRTLPVIVEIARKMSQLAPDALLANFTNPAGLVTEALVRYAPEVNSVGVCNVGITTRMDMVKELEKILGHPVSSKNVMLDTLGLNHLTWHRGLTIDGENMWPVIFENYLESLLAEEQLSGKPEWDPILIKTLGMIPNYYLHYYYETGRVLVEQQHWPPSRAEKVMKIEKDLLELYADPALNTVPEELMRRGGAYYSTLAAELVDSHHNDLGNVHVVNVPNQGAVQDWPDDWVLEVPCKVDRNGFHPLPAEPLPKACFGLVSQVKMFELLTVEAAMHGDRKALYEALLAHPLGPDASLIPSFINDLLETHKSYLPQFFS